MNSDEMLLRDARAAQNQLDALESEAERKRLRYYQSIRRLHSAGVSMRSIAEALDLSHQRIHQIINGGGQMERPTPQKNLVRRLMRRTGKECPPDERRGEPGGLLLERFYVDAREAMARAQEEAGALCHSYIGTEHLLLGLLRAEHGLAARILTAIGTDLETARSFIETLVGRGEGTVRPPLPVTPRLKKVLELARLEAKRLHSTHIRSEHVLLGLAREGGGLAARMLTDLGVNYEQLRRRVDRAALACSFCGRSGLDSTHLISGPKVYICDRCTEEASRLTESDASGSDSASLSVVDTDPS
ncbi:MAG TPA: Clp protease N-terminal domain-containing protein, partial [Chloroflexota bacterium]